MRGACPGRPFVGGHDPSCPDAEGSGVGAEAAIGWLGPRLSYFIDPAAPLVRLLYHGAPSFEEWQQTMEAVLADPAYRPGFPFLVDRRFDEPASPEYVRRVIRFLWLHVAKLAGSRWAIVTWTPASYGMARVKKAMAFDLPLPIEVFKDLEQAERWLRETAPR